MLNPFKEVDWNPDRSARRKFAVSWIVGFPIVAVLLLLIGRAVKGGWNVESALWIAGCGAGAGAVLWALPQIAKPFYVLWFGFGCSVGILVGNLLFCACFLLLVTPFGLLKRLAGSRAIAKSFDRNAPTYWRDVEPVKDPKRYYRQY